MKRLVAIQLFLLGTHLLLAQSMSIDSCQTNQKKDVSNNTIVFNVGGVPFTMICVEGGTFQMGEIKETRGIPRNEKPVHLVTLSSYYIGETEVTQELWQAVMGSNPSKFKFKGSKKPVENVSWNDCQEFLRKLNLQTGQQFRLPTEAEWEYAARGGNKSRGYQYSGSNTLDEVAWYTRIKEGNGPHEVKRKLPNELGIFDMSGNVWEWCQDWYGRYNTLSQTNPIGASSGSCRVYRGGSWFDFAKGCRVSKRGYYTPGSRDFYLGLRLAL